MMTNLDKYIDALEGRQGEKLWNKLQLPVRYK